MDLVGELNRLANISPTVQVGSALGTAGLRLPGTSGNYISTPDSVLNSITGDIDIRVYCKLDDWTPAVATNLIGKYTTTGNLRSYRLYVNTDGSINYASSQDGTTVTNAASTVIPTFVDGSAQWLRATHDVDNGSGQNVVKLYTSTDGVTWTQLGATFNVTGVVAILDSTAPLELGSITGGTLNPLAGTIYYAEVRNGIDGPVVAKFDSSQVQVSGAQSPATINGWTWNGAALYKRDDYVRLPGTSGNYLSYPDTAANSVTGDIDIRAKVSADSWTPAGAVYVIGKEVVGARSYCFGLSAGGQIEMRFSTDGTNAIAVNSSVIAGFASGTTNWIRATRQASSGNCNFYTSSDGSTWSLLGTADRNGTAGNIADSTSAVELGSRVNGTANLWAGNVYYAEVRNGINGPAVASFDGRDNQVQTPWTINGAGWNWEGASFTGKPGIVYQTPGAGNGWVSTPDTAGNSVTGDIDIRAKVSLVNWADGVNFQAFVSKRATSQNAYQLRVDPNGGLTGLIWIAAASATVTSPPLGLTAGAVKWVRLTRVSATGALVVYTSDDGLSWTTVGTNTGVTGASDDTTAALTIGSGDSGTSQMMAGKVYYAEVRAGIDGPIVAKFDATNIAKTGTRTPATTVQPGGTPNMLTPNQASIETDVTGWDTNNGNTTIARSTAQFLDGAASLSITAIGVGTTAIGLFPAGSPPIVPGKLYNVSGYFKAGATARTVRVGIDWLTSADVYISSLVPSTVTDATGTWTQATGIGVAPATAAKARVVGFITDAAQAAAEVHYVDRISLVEAAEVWTMNGSAWSYVNTDNPPNVFTRSKEMLGAAGAANLWAGTVGLELQGALNAKAGLPVNGTCIDMNGILKRLGFDRDRNGALMGPAGQVENVLRLPGISGNYASTPDSALNSVTGDIDIRVKFAQDHWATAADTYLISKWTNSGSQISWVFWANPSGGLAYGWSTNGSATTFKSSSANMGLADGQVVWVRVVHDVDNGAAGNDIKFYTSSDGVAWAQLGATVTTAGTTSIFDGTAPVRIGGVDSGSSPVAAAIYYAEVRDGIAGPVVASFDATQIPVRGVRTPTTYTSPQGETWTVNGTNWWWDTYTGAQRWTNYVALPGTAGNYASTPDSAATSIVGDIDIRVKAAASDWTPASYKGMVSKGATVAGQFSYVFYVAQTTGFLNFIWSVDGTATISKSSNTIPIVADGATIWVRVTMAVATGQVTFYSSPDGVTWTQLGGLPSAAGATSIFDGTASLIAGGDASTSQNWAGNIYYAEVRNGINGTLAAVFDPNKNRAPIGQTPATIPSVTGETWTMNGTGWNYGIQDLG